MATGLHDKKIVLTETVSRLAVVEGRLKALMSGNPTSAEAARFQMIRDDLASQLTEAELAAYEKSKLVELTPKEKKEAAERLRLEMEANRDKPSI
jgi:hypothetical protein